MTVTPTLLSLVEPLAVLCSPLQGSSVAGDQSVDLYSFTCQRKCQSEYQEPATPNHAATSEIHILLMLSSGCLTCVAPAHILT